jgi:hypothetical protein
VQFHLDATVSLFRGIDFPSIGDEIDGCIKRNGKLDIPWFTLDAADVNHDIPQDLTAGQRVRIRVTEIVTNEPTDTVMSMFYRFVVTKLCLTFVGPLPDSK